MPLVPLAEAARRLGKPERTVRRWAAHQKLVAQRHTDGWYVEMADETSAARPSGGVFHGSTELATVPTSYLADLEARAEQAAFQQGRAEVLANRVRELQEQLALPSGPPPKPWWQPRFWFRSTVISSVAILLSQQTDTVAR